MTFYAVLLIDRAELRVRGVGVFTEPSPTIARGYMTAVLVQFEHEPDPSVAEDYVQSYVESLHPELLPLLSRRAG